jgi:hypothetical protein
MKHRLFIYLSFILGGCGTTSTYNTDLDFSNDTYVIEEGVISDIWGSNIPTSVERIVNVFTGNETVLGRAFMVGDTVQIEINMHLIEERGRSFHIVMLHELMHGLFAAPHERVEEYPETGCTKYVMATYTTDVQGREECWILHRADYIEQYWEFYDRVGGKFVTEARFNQLKSKLGVSDESPYLFHPIY